MINEIVESDNYRFELLSPEHFPLIEVWFDDMETQKYLGGRNWLYNSIELMTNSIGVEFHENIVTARYVWTVFESKNPVALIDIELYDNKTAGFAFVVTPEKRNQGIGRKVLLLLKNRPELTDIRILIGGVEPKNTPSRKCLEKAGFKIENIPDDEGMLRVKRRLR